MAFGGGEKASRESTPPSQCSALCRQRGPAAALCPVLNLSAVLVTLSPEVYVPVFRQS